MAVASVVNSLYPPIIDVWMPAFVRSTPCRVYFSLSPYNSLSDFKKTNNAQVIVSSQNSNLSALNSSTYPADIMLTTITEDGSIEGDDRYYITISPSDMQDGFFEIGQYYKVQIRFTGAGAKDPPSDGKIAGWLTENQAYFSEWSTVCLIRGIQQPEIYLKGFEDATSSSNETIFSSEVVQLVGGMYYEENSSLEDEYLKSYEVNVYHADSGVLVYESGIVYTNEFNPNEINYTLKCNLEDGVRYLLELVYTTNDEYTATWAYYFSVVTAGIDTLNATITAEAEPQYGRIAIHIDSTLADIFVGNICIRRSSSETDFTVWEDIHIVTIQGERLDYTWYDYTVQSSIYYRYCAQRVNGKGERGPIISIRYPVMVYLYDMFLTRDEFQLDVKYNPSISSFKVTFNESKTDTLGSKYPFIRRNGNVAYRTFPISGLITAFCDEDHIFGTSREDFYGDMIDYYDKVNNDAQITEYKDFIYEKFFRDKVMDFLHGNDVKLFRSQTEGNILVKLMDISFTPNQTLGRMLYSFSATAYEIDEYTIENCAKYGVLDLGEYSTLTEFNYQATGQITGTYSDVNMVQVIQDKYDLTASTGFTNVVRYLSWVRIEFESEPYIIKCGADGSLTPATADDEFDDTFVSGYIVYINNEPILVSGRGYFELGDDDTEITSIWFPVDTQITLDYTAEINEEENKSIMANTLTYSFKVGQLWGSFDVDSSISKAIYVKYLWDYSTYYQKLLSIDKITVEAVPGAVIYVKDSFDDDYFRHEVGPTGSLRLYDDEATITAFYFCGIHLNETFDYSRLEAEDARFRETGITVNTLDEITDPIKNGVYTILELDALSVMNIPEDDNTGAVYNKDVEQYANLLRAKITSSDHRFIYYEGQWYVFTADNDVMCPVHGIVDYIIELVKGEY